LLVDNNLDSLQEHQTSLEQHTEEAVQLDILEFVVVDSQGFAAPGMVVLGMVVQSMAELDTDAQGMAELDMVDQGMVVLGMVVQDELLLCEQGLYHLE
jgi:hypothetical protein